jgi:hypothetical protein
MERRQQCKIIWFIYIYIIFFFFAGFLRDKNCSWKERRFIKFSFLFVLSQFLHSFWNYFIDSNIIFLGFIKNIYCSYTCFLQYFFLYFSANLGGWWGSNALSFFVIFCKLNGIKKQVLELCSQNFLILELRCDSAYVNR